MLLFSFVYFFVISFVSSDVCANMDQHTRGTPVPPPSHVGGYSLPMRSTDVHEYAGISVAISEFSYKSWNSVGGVAKEIVILVCQKCSITMINSNNNEKHAIIMKTMQ